MVCGEKYNPGVSQTTWEKWINEGIDFSVDACFTIMDLLRFIGQWKLRQLLTTWISECRDWCSVSYRESDTRFVGAELRFKLSDGAYVTYCTSTCTVRCCLDEMEWACYELSPDIVDNLAEMLLQIWQEKRENQA